MIINFYFYRKSKNIKNEESEEEVEIKNDIIVGVSQPKETQKVKRILSINDHQNKKIKSSMKKKKSFSSNWTVSDE
jgi:hypothetical protein